MKISKIIILKFRRNFLEYNEIYISIVIFLSEELIISEIEKHKDEYIEFFRELIKTESYNPPGNEKNVAVKIKKFLDDADIECELFEVKENRANLIAYLNNNLEGKNLLFNGHMDVVPPGDENEWKYPPLSATVKRKKYIYGRGSADMKGGTAAMAIVLKILKSLDLKLSGNIIFNAVADEETGGKYGTNWCLENKLKSINCDFAIVGEATDLKPLSKAILVGEKGRVQLKIVANGAACHASAPFLGTNAIYMMGEIIQNLDKLEDLIPNVDPPIELNKLKELVAASFPNKESFKTIYKQQPLLSNTIKALTQFTKSMTMINAGIKENVVPDVCVAKMDFRLLPGQDVDMVIDGVKTLITDLGYNVKLDDEEETEEVYFKLEIEEESEPSYWKDWEDSKDLQTLYSIVEKVYDKKPFYFLLPASADANFLRNTGYCPETVIFGPGVATTAHTSEEYVEIQDFINTIKTYALFAYEILK
ncbi:MAG: ArgE/DapE family deacylase [Candidatus Lokiarchaeota archaeon]|nr:ArgE/DapE family deacylase [Candidatus Lokiarchaeota archaeon]MBD3343403.1 ArgE/DapE family deacylase [Candidatus Lokiarchaeota archaeon]